jgi:hypothetical protein
VQMLVQLRSDLVRRNIRLALAHGIGQVRDVLDRATTQDEPLLFATIEEAVSALRR